MSLDQSEAKLVIRSLLDVADGAVGEFVSISDVLARSGPGAAAALKELIARRWIRVRGDTVAATRWAIEFGMDWTNVSALLRAILNSAGGVGTAANLGVVIAASGLPEREVQKLLNELSMLDLAHSYATQLNGGGLSRGASLTARGWDYLTTGSYKPRCDLSDQLSAFNTAREAGK
jgi:hypothetical protein